MRHAPIAIVPSRVRPVLALALAGAPVAAQGSDSCSTAQAITGLGTFLFETTAATTDGLANGCEGQIEKDVWFEWSASASGSLLVETCELTAVDTVLAAYPTDACPPDSPLAWNDDSCDVQSRIWFPVVAGSSYLLRVGVRGLVGGPGLLRLATGPSGGCAQRSVGPDVIVGDLPSVQRWGTVGTVTAYSLATVSCNVGDHPLQWEANTNQHPVIGQNAYRLEDDRFEQIGMSWLKHGFLALAQNLCCNCVAPGTGALLGVGCSDPYSASLNGEQGGLGPRSEVDPWTGRFPYPFGAQGQTGDAIYKRMQVVNDDLDPALHPGARYFAEGHYVSPDDASARNQSNNVSWRELEVTGFSGGGWNLLVSGPTHRRAPAILAWQAVNPAVRIEGVQAPCDGLFLVGSLASDNGDGTWRYEYAVYNMNSARSGQAFEVPLQQGTTVSGVGFHGIEHHSGEPYSKTPWVSTVTSDHVRWQTDTFDVDQNANALRWGTLYNFRFDASAPPVDGSATLTLFVPGTPDSLFPSVPVPGDGCTTRAFCRTSPNSAGDGAHIGATGSTSIAANDFGLTAGACPPSQSGIFYYGPDAVELPFGNGYRCVAGSLVRLRLQQTDASGGAGRPIDYGDLPPNGQIQAGDTWRFQFWYRDPMHGGAFFNLTEGLEARFCP